MQNSLLILLGKLIELLNSHCFPKQFLNTPITFKCILLSPGDEDLVSYLGQ
jgi:hypothetical protein